MMFKDKYIHKLYAFALAAVFALTLAGCGGGGGGSAAAPDPGTTPAPDPAIAERAAISGAIDAAEAAVGMVNDTASDATVAAADAAIAAANAAIAAAANVPDAEKAANSGTVSVLETALSMAKTSRTAAMNAADDAANMAMMATAMKLHSGISAPSATAAATYGTDPNADDIAVTNGTTVVNLSEDKDATVPAHHGWTGMRFTHTVPSTATDGAGDTYEAVVYSNVGEPTAGAKFSEQYTANFANGVLDETTTEGTASRVASPSFDQSAGVKSFELPTNNVAVMIAGSYNGVSGTYSCVPGTGNTCAVQVAADGFTLGTVADNDNDPNTPVVFTAAGGTWTFKPTNPDALLMSTPDAIYASYGWWLHKSANGETFTASAFAADKGTITDAAGILALQGTATYMGGAAGKYALRSLTGGTNDAGHFTARATLEADFSDNTISGTIDNFVGADDQSRNWSVELKETDISDTGVIDGLGGAANDVQVGTVWTINGSAAAGAGQWSGSLQENGDDGVPKIGTGTFHSMFGADGNMVGAFGVNKQ